MINVETAWDKVPNASRSNVTIAILDTGINANHEDLKDSIVPDYNFVNNNTNTTDQHGHGTHVAGIATALTNNSKEKVGIATSI